MLYISTTFASAHDHGNVKMLQCDWTRGAGTTRFIALYMRLGQHSPSGMQELIVVCDAIIVSIARCLLTSQF